MDREDELQGIIDFQEEEIKKLKDIIAGCDEATKIVLKNLAITDVMELLKKAILSEHNDLVNKHKIRYDELKNLFGLHNLLPFLASGKCTCDSDVGMTSCMSCAAKDILEKALKG